MKNSQKGFIVPALIIIIGLLVVGGSVYVWKNKATKTPTVTDQSQQSNRDQISQETSDNNTSPTATINAGKNENPNAIKDAWSVYSDPKWGYTISVPPNASNPFQNGFMKINVQSAGNPETYRASQQYSLDLQKKSSQPSRFTFSKVTINGVEAFRTVDDQSLVSSIPNPRYEVVYDFIKGNNLYHVGFTASIPLSEQAKEAQSIFEQMVLTFKI